MARAILVLTRTHPSNSLGRGEPVRVVCSFNKELVMNKRLAVFVSAIGLFIGVVTSVLAQAPQTRPEPGNKPIETFTARAFQMQRGASGVVEITITRWSTDAEREMLLGVLAEAGQPAMLDALQKLPQVGYIKMPNTMGVALFYARSNELPDGTRQVVIGTDRTIGMATAAPQASKYDATIIEIRFKKGSEKGEGKMVLAGKASIGKDGKVQISNYQGEPVRLMDVKSTKP
jgi:hypothetical protein